MQTKIVHYQPAYAPDFERLNREWIERFFRIEESDLYTFSHIDTILRDGGQIFFALDGTGHVVGCCALIWHEDAQCFELGKMAVTPAAQGQHIGYALGQEALNYARQRGARRIVLEGNTRLVASIALYKKLGFKPIPLQGQAYARCDILMQIEL
ncbi:MAG: GNAT family N-acetyltransferase [Bacteroidaceae bacterium]|nr:GNAT family N-acetyltransferase [Bacteroidaceae bacterium]